MGGNWYRNLFGGRRPDNPGSTTGRRQGKLKAGSRTKPGKTPDENEPGTLVRISNLLFDPLYRHPKARGPVGMPTDHDSRYYMSSFSAVTPALLTVSLCLVLETPYPFTWDMARFERWRYDGLTILTPVLSLYVIVGLCNVMGCLWALGSSRVPEQLAHWTRRIGRLFDCGMVLFAYKGTLGLLKVWETLDRNQPLLCFQSDQCPVKGSICQDIAILAAVPQLLFGRFSNLCEDKLSKKAGELFLIFLVEVMIVSCIILYTLYGRIEKLKMLENGPVVRAKLSQAQKKKKKEAEAKGLEEQEVDLTESELHLDEDIIEIPEEMIERLRKARSPLTLPFEQSTLPIPGTLAPAKKKARARGRNRKSVKSTS